MRINAALVDNADFPDLTRDYAKLLAVGGGWRKIASFPTPEMNDGRPLPPGVHIYTLYRRDPPQP